MHNHQVQEKGRLLDSATLLAAGLYLLLTIIITWPVAANLNRQLAGEGTDIYSHLWTFHWVRDALFSGQNPFFTTRIFYPTGVSLANHNIAWLHILLWIPLQALFGSTAGYNILFLAILTANGIAMFLLARELLNNDRVAFVSGLIYAFWPYTLSQNDHPNFMFITWVPLALLFLRRALQGNPAHHRRNALLVALFLALTGWVRWQLLIMAAFPMGLYTLALLWPQDWAQRKQSLLLLLGIGVTTAVLLLPIAIPVATYQLTRDNPAELYLDEHGEKQTDLLAYVTPTELHPLWEETLKAVYGRFHDNFNVQNQTRRPYLGYTVILLALIGAIAAASRSRAWTIIAILLILFALGPTLRINGIAYPQIPMPYRLIANNPLMRLLRLTDRMNVLLGIPIAMLAGFGIMTFFKIMRHRVTQFVVIAFFSLLILGEYAAFPFPESTTHVPDWLAARQDDPDDYAILHLPNHLYEDNKFYMYYQITHHKPIINGKVARVPREALALWESIPLLKQVQDEQSVNVTLPDISRQLELLHDVGVRYVVIHKALAEEGQIIAWRDWFTIEPLHEDDELIVYTTTPQAGRDFFFAHTLTPEIGLIRQNISPDTAVSGGTIKVNLRLGSTAAPKQALHACFQLLAAASSHSATICQPITPTWPT
ncbi:MAG: hypothetical protein KC415_15095, partial [Anaerolineales bacterium]|nr:hypothetical protein [Anaerolineales bacterium]